MDFGPIRAIEGDTILSPSLPRLGVRISSDFIYLGDLMYIARETYHVEEFIFISPNGHGHATRLLLIHFAGFLENKEGAYAIKPQRSIQLDGEDYQYEVRFIDINDYLDRFPSSDIAHAADYIRQRAYTLAGDMVFHRIARLVSPDQRNQFIIAYLENNPNPLLNEEALQQDEAKAQALLDRALSSFTILH